LGGSRTSSEKTKEAKALLEELKNILYSPSLSVLELTGFTFLVQSMS